MPEIIFKSLKSKIDFAEMYKSGKRYFAHDAMALVRFRDAKDNEGESDKSESKAPQTLKYVVSVSKRNAKKAVVRNRIKRLLRESIKDYFNDETHSEKAEAFDTLIINWRRTPKQPMKIRLDDVRPTVNYLIRKAYKNNKHSSTGAGN
ncbi:MAG: ribonuclease P protein component [Chlorobi bacterium]|nr:ribonuclease P protein component [Chlorobiota bacterium]